MHLVMSSVFSKEIGLFEQCKTQETAYKFIWDRDIDPDYAEEYI